LQELALKCQEVFGLTIGKSSIHRALHASGYSYITGRKKHYKSNEKEQEDFKKNAKKRSSRAKSKSISLMRHALAPIDR
jgi:transposase